MVTSMNVPIYSYQVLNYTFEVWDHKPKIDGLCDVNQVHGNMVINADNNQSCEADGMISEKGVPLVIKTADCLPIAFISESASALVHAGWRGLAKNILINKNILSLNPSKIFIGPHIRMMSYEVSAEFTKNFPKSNNFKEIEGRIFFDITEQAKQQLRENYPLAEIIDCNIDTFTDHRFKSFRNGDKELRNWNILRKI